MLRAEPRGEMAGLRADMAGLRTEIANSRAQTIRTVMLSMLVGNATLVGVVLAAVPR